MLRASLCAVLALALISMGLLAAEAKKEEAKKNDKGKAHRATITKVDKKNGTITVRMKDKNGKETERTFKLTEDIRYVDSTGKAAAIDVFQSGNEVLVIEEQGRLKQLKHADRKARRKERKERKEK